jgi:hypothetical protein
MKTRKLELLAEREKTQVVVKDYMIEIEEDRLSLVYTEILSQDGRVIDTFLTDVEGDGISEAEFPGLRREIQEFLFPEEFKVESNQ